MSSPRPVLPDPKASALPAPAGEEPRIDSTFRNGSVTAIGIVTGFSLGFLTQWVNAAGNWTTTDLLAVSLIAIGVGFQIKSLYDFLAPESVFVSRYRRAVGVFRIGLLVTASGVGLAVLVDIVGLGEQVLHP